MYSTCTSIPVPGTTRANSNEIEIDPEPHWENNVKMSIVFGPTFGTFLTTVPRLFYELPNTKLDYTTTPKHKIQNSRYTNIKFKSYHKLVSDVHELPFRASWKLIDALKNMKQFELCINNERSNKQTKQYTLYHIYRTNNSIYTYMLSRWVSSYIVLRLGFRRVERV